MNPRFPSFPWKYGEREKTWWRQCYGVGLCSYLWDHTYTSDTRLLVLLGHVAADRRTRMIFEVYRTTPSAQFEQNAAKLIGHRFSPSAWWHKSILQKTRGLQVKGTDIHQWPSQSHDLNTTERLLNAKLSAERPTSKQQLRVTAVRAEQSIWREETAFSRSRFSPRHWKTILIIKITLNYCWASDGSTQN